MINVDVTLYDLKNQLDHINHYLNAKRVVNVKYHRPSIEDDGHACFTNM